MATPLKIDAIAAECRKLGATVKIWPGAATIGRPGSFNIHGITVHITAGGLGSRTAQQYINDIIDMSAKTSDPVRANAVADPDGTLWLTAQGRSNHALYYSQKAYDACLNATFPDSGSVDWRGGLTRWSDYTYGIELIAGSGAKVTSKQRRAALIYTAAICRLYGWTGGEIHGHGEVSKDRSPLPSGDPGIDMGAFRRDAKHIIKAGPSDPITTNPGIPSQEDDMPLTNDDVRKIWITDNILPNPVKGQGVDAKNAYWTANSIIGYAARHSLMAERKTDANTDQIADLSGQLAGLKTAVGKILDGQPISLDQVTDAASKAAAQVITAAANAAAQAAKDEIQ